MTEQYNEITDTCAIVNEVRSKQALKITADLQEIINLLEGISDDPDENSRCRRRCAIGNLCREIEQDVQNL